MLFFYAVPIKALAGFYSRANSFGEVIHFVLVDEMLVQKSFYLWFLPVLFLIFILTYLIEKHIGLPCKYKFCVLLVVSFGYSVIPINVLSLTAKMAVWFYAGYCFEDYRERLNSQVKSRPQWIGLSFLPLFAIFIIIELIPNPKGFDVWTAIRKPLEALCAVSGCLSIYLISYFISRTEIPQNKAFQLIRENTFGLYLFSDPWNYSVLAVMTALFDKDVFVTNWGSAVTYFMRMFVTAGIGLAVSILLKKMNKKYKLRGG